MKWFRVEDTPEISEAILRVFLEHDDHTNRKKACLKYVLDANGFDWMVEKIQEKLDGFGNDVKLMPFDKQCGNIGVYVQSSAHFHIPDNDDAPLIIIGPGTGIAPFRAFLEEREMREAKGDNWLFFGDRTRHKTFIP